MKLNLGCGGKILPGFVNVDKCALQGVNEVVDLFTVPWPWRESSIDEIQSSHLIEHIPHQQSAMPDYDWPARVMNDCMQRLITLDSFLAFFAEAWRVLVPGGTITCIAPWGMSHQAWQDPYHVRAIMPGTVAYLTGEIAQDQPSADYALPFRFEQVGSLHIDLCDQAARARDVGRLDEAQHLLLTLWNQATEIGFTLRAVKETR